MYRIVVGVDGSENSHNALKWAVSEAELRSAHILIVHAWMEPAVVAIGETVTSAVVEFGAFEEAARQTMHDALQAVDMKSLAGGVDHRVVGGTPAKAVLDAAEGADLIVVGSRGRGGFTGLMLGSVSQQVAHHATCPVVIVPSRPQ
jgi:nucleotide-binding universal stress UspA family protein